MATDAPHTMQCSEVWGGNDEVDRAVMMPGLDARVVSRPAAGDAAGGDIHYLSSCATGRITRVLVADVTGHGERVAALAGRLRGLMRRYVNFVDQSRLVAAINREFAAVSDGGKFATALVATFWGPSADLDITNAGHPRPLIYRAARGSWEALDPAPGERAAGGAPSDLPLGIMEGVAYARSRVAMSRGDLALLYTDALPEARAPDGSFLGVAGLVRMLNGLGPTPAAEVIPRLMQELTAFRGGRPLDDDATMLLLSRNALRIPRGSVLLGLKTSARLAWELMRSIRPGGCFARPELRRDNIAGAWLDRFNRRGRG